MMNGLEALRSTPEDKSFHSQRRMFWIIEGEVQEGEKGSEMSHLEMAISRGWVEEETQEEFFRKNPRGFYLSDGNRVHFYRGIGFGFDETLKEEVLGILPKVRTSLQLDNQTNVFLGPKDSLIKGVEYRIERLGTIEELLKEG